MQRKDSAESEGSENLHHSREHSNTRSRSMGVNKNEILRSSLKSLNHRHIERPDESLI